MARFDRAAWAPKPPEFEGGGLLVDAFTDQVG